MYPYQKATAVNKVNIPVSIISLQIQISAKTIVCEGMFRYHCQGSSPFVLMCKQPKLMKPETMWATSQRATRHIDISYQFHSSGLLNRSDTLNVT